MREVIDKNYTTAGGGSMVGAIKGSTQKEPLVVGKPSTFMMDYVSKKCVGFLSNFFIPWLFLHKCIC